MVNRLVNHSNRIRSKKTTSIKSLSFKDIVEFNYRNKDNDNYDKTPLVFVLSVYGKVLTGINIGYLKEYIVEELLEETSSTKLKSWPLCDKAFRTYNTSKIGTARPRQLDEVRDVWDFGEWFAGMFAEQVPNLALIYFTAGLGTTAGMSRAGITSMAAATEAEIAAVTTASRAVSLSSMSAAAAGRKYGQMKQDFLRYRETEGMYGYDYSFTDMLLASVGTGIAEGASELITFNLMKGATDDVLKAFSQSARSSIKKKMSQGFGNYMKKHVLTTSNLKNQARNVGNFLVGKEAGLLYEPLSEVVATVSENYFTQMAGNDDVYIWD